MPLKASTRPHYLLSSAQRQKDLELHKRPTSTLSQERFRKEELLHGHLHVSFSFPGFRCLPLPQTATNPATRNVGCTDLPLPIPDQSVTFSSNESWSQLSQIYLRILGLHPGLPEKHLKHIVKAALMFSP